MTQVQNFSVIGAKGVLIQLIKYPELNGSDSLIIPVYENYETDGGKPAARIKEEVYAPIGEILQISDTVKKQFEEESIDLKVGDHVLIQNSAKVSYNWFVISPNHPIADFDGKLVIHHNNIIAKLTLQNG